MALRLRIVLASAAGQSEVAIAAGNGVNRKTVRLWRSRFLAKGLEGLWGIAPGRGRKATYSPERIKEVIDATLQSKPEASTHWSCRTLAEARELLQNSFDELYDPLNGGHRSGAITDASSCSPYLLRSRPRRRQDPSALAILERRHTTPIGGIQSTYEQELKLRFVLRHVETFPLGTHYFEIVRAFAS